jgi:hypothetical protein
MFLTLTDAHVRSRFIDVEYSLVPYALVGKDKGKAIPLEALTGPECSRRLRLPDFKTIST